MVNGVTYLYCQLSVDLHSAALHLFSSIIYVINILLITEGSYAFLSKTLLL